MEKTIKKLATIIVLFFIMSICMTGTIFADGTTRTWDGEGEDDNWSTAKNWSGDVVPDAYDTVIFDSTSTKYVNVDGEKKVYKLIINDGYTGEINGETLTVTNDFEMNDGSVNLYRLNIDGTTKITTGKSLACAYFYTYGDIDISGLENPIESEMHISKDKNIDKETIINGDFEVSSIFFDDINHDYQINGRISINKGKGSINRLEFNNRGNIIINDGAKIDISKCENYYNRYDNRYDYTYYNYGNVTENGTGRLYFDANDFYFCDSKGYPIIKSSVGENIFISLIDFDSNFDKEQKDTVTVIVKRESDVNDTATVTLTETDNDSSIFRNLTGLELVDSNSTPNSGQLKYDGVENLIAEYTDSNSPDDKKSCKMDRNPIIWDGEGKEDYGDPIYDWNCGQNWSTDTVPKMYDIVLFNNTSSKNALQSLEYEISKIVVDDGYKGEIKFERSYDQNEFKTKVFNDIVAKDGTITLNSNMTINGDVDIEGGKLKTELNISDSIINGKLNLSGGEFNFLGKYLNLKGDLNVSNGSFISRNGGSTSEINLYSNADISGGTINIQRSVIKEAGNTITINNVDGKIVDELVIEENTEFKGNMSVGSLILNSNKTLDIDGVFTCYVSFINNGTIYVADGSTLDFKGVITYKNNIINDNNTGKILYNSGGIGFVNQEGTPIGTAKVGDEIYVELIDLSNNKNINVKETVVVTVSSITTGDTETISLTETDVNTSIFRSELGLELISTGTSPGLRQLQFNGSEDLEAVYVDARDENDIASCNLYRNPIIWDGGGTDNNWTTPENWSNDTVPTRYDVITLNNTSIKDINIDKNIEMYKLNVVDSYTGEITVEENVSFYVASDMTIAGGTIDISGRFQAGGNLSVSGGSIYLQYNDSTKHNIVGGNLSVSGGEVLARGYFDIKGNMLISEGSFKPSYEGASTYIYAYGDVDLLVKTEIGELYMYGNHLNCSTDKENLFSKLCINTDGNVEITGKIKTKYFDNNSKSITDISGKETILTLDEQGAVNNYSILNIKDEAIFNGSKYNYNNSSNQFYNIGQINEINGGKFYCDTKDMYFINTSGNRIVFANVNDEVFTKLFDVNINKNGSKKEEVIVTVENLITGDSEDITLTETTVDSGIFTNSSGLLLVSEDSALNDGKLKYNGTEDLQSSYTDSTDSEDNYTCNLLRKPLVWDGGGKDNNWITAENWSEDRIPDEYDNIVFNDTSDKSAETSSQIPKVSSMTIEDTYKGIVEVVNELNIEEDVTVNGGKLKIGERDISGDFIIQANGDLILGGGIIEDNCYGEDIFNNVIITGGEFIAYNLKVKNNLEMNGGKLIDNYSNDLTVEGDIIITKADKFQIDTFEINGDITITNAEKFYCYRLDIYGNNINVTKGEFTTDYLNVYTDGEVNINGNINIESEYVNSYFGIGSNSTLNLNGKIEFCEVSENGLNNFGTLNINNNSILDVRKARKFENSGTITISDTAKLYYNAEAMGVTDEKGAPTLNDFNFGESLIVSLIDKNRNLSNSVVENADVKLINWTNGDEETYTLVETGSGTCEFRGVGFNTGSSDTATKDNNIFEGQDSDAFQFTYTDIMSGRVEYVVSKNCAELEIEGIDDLIVDGIDYGNGDINGNSNSFTLTLQNKGDKPLEIQEISLDNTDNFSFSEEPDTSDMEPDSTRDIVIDFKPTSLGEKTVDLTIKTNDNDEGLITIPIKGIGVEPPVSFGIDDIIMQQGTESYLINIFEIFEDTQDSDEDLEYSIINNYSPLVIGAVTDKTKGTLTLQFSTSQSGDEFITLRVMDTSNAYVDEVFRVIVSENHTILGKTVDSEGNAIEGATVTIMDSWNNEKCYTGITSSGGTFSVSFPANEINLPRKIRISKDNLKYSCDSDEWGNVNLGTITLTEETDEEKVQRLANDLTVECLGFQNDDSESSITKNLLLEDTAGEGSTINWSSSEPNVISDTGVVTRPTYGSGDVMVIMTATVHVNDVTAQKEFYVFAHENDTPGMEEPSVPILQSAVAGNGHVTLTWTDETGATGYMVYKSTISNSYELPLTIVDNSVNSYDITDLNNGTTYYFVVRASYSNSDSENSNEISATPYKPSSGGSNKHTKPTNGVDILVNGKTEKAATSITTEIEGKKVTTVTVDDKKVEDKLQNEDNNAVVTIPVKNNSDVVVGQLNGQTVKNMETKEAVLEIKTENVTYTLPASQINIDNVSSEIGNKVELEDIAVNVKISEPSQDTVKIVEDTANKNNYQIVVKPIEFEISCSSSNKAVRVSKFNAYVERTIEIPDNVDASKITTGIVLNPGGTFSHVPTTIIVIDGKYYAKINSLTNSTYSVIYSPRSFKDVENHWAKSEINDMGSRLVINGVGDDYFKPDDDITRAEFTTIVVKALGLMRTGTGKDVFNDVPENESYYDAVSIAYEYDIISGYSNGNFDPMEKITREEVMTIIARAMKITELKVELQDGEDDKFLAEFDDYEKLEDWSKNSIASCIKAKIVFGRNKKLIAPKDNITRAEVAVVVRRLLKNSKLI